MAPVKTSALVVCAWLVVVVWSIIFVAFHLSSSQDNNNYNVHLEQTLADGYQQKLQAQLESAQRRVQELEEKMQQQQELISISTATRTAVPQLKSQPDIPCHQVDDQVDKQMLQKQSEPISIIDPPFPSRNPVCRALPYPIPNAAALWTHYIPQIHKASQLPNDHKFYFHDFTAQLLHLISPRLPQSVKTVPRDHSWKKLDEILQVAFQRYDYITNRDAWVGRTPPRPLKILIMGGSLLVGVNCRKLASNLGLQLRLPNTDCSWANRLEKLINQFLLGEILSTARDEQLDSHYIVQVTRVAMGGTNTETGSAILEYDLMPPDAKNPDMVINAYATNDMHIITMLEAKHGNTTLRDKIFDMTQDFVRLVMDPTPNNVGGGRPECQKQQQEQRLPPLLVHMDDYLGNEQREIWATTELSQGVQVLANYYGFASASYADLVRDFVYGDTREYWFSPQGWYTSDDKEGSFAREIHPNMGMHIIAAWAMGYNFLNMITTFCSLEGFNLHRHSGVTAGHRMDYNSTSLNHLPDLTGQYWPPGKPKAQPQGLPPVLNKTLSLEDVSRLWQETDIASKQQQRPNEKSSLSQSTLAVDCHDTQKDIVKCPFSWLSGISSEHTKAHVAEAFFKEHVTFLGDWAFKDDHGKLGIVPSAPLIPLILELPRLTQPIRKVTIFHMRSYGSTWANSQVQVQILKRDSDVTEEADWQQLQKRSIVGFHAKATSETYTEVFDLSDSPIGAGETLILRLVLVEGTTFKIMGVAFCS